MNPAAAVQKWKIAFRVRLMLIRTPLGVVAHHMRGHTPQDSATGDEARMRDMIIERDLRGLYVRMICSAQA
jgi:hypothetical protein